MTHDCPTHGPHPYVHRQCRACRGNTNFIVTATMCRVWFGGSRCYQFDDGALLLNADFRISCHSSRYKAMLAVSVAMSAVFPIGVPLFLAYTLWRRRESLYPRNHALTIGVVHSPDGVQPTVIAVKTDNLLPSLRPLLHDKVLPVPLGSKTVWSIDACLLQWCYPSHSSSVPSLRTSAEWGAGALMAYHSTVVASSMFTGAEPWQKTVCQHFQRCHRSKANRW